MLQVHGIKDDKKQRKDPGGKKRRQYIKIKTDKIRYHKKHQNLGRRIQIETEFPEPKHENRTQQADNA